MHAQTDSPKPPRRHWRIPSPEEFRLWLREHREALRPRLSQRTLARIAGVNRMTIWRIERGDKEPTLDLAQRLWSTVRRLETKKTLIERRILMRFWEL